jgi:hypothetical protein
MVSNAAARSAADGGPVRVDQPLNQDAAKQRLMQGANRPGNPLIVAVGIDAVEGMSP